MFLLAAIQAKIFICAFLALIAVVVGVVYLPIAMVREMTRNEADELPEWMGTVKARRTRLRIIFCFFGILAMAAVIFVARGG